MKIYKTFILLTFIILIYGCGIKADPIPKSSLDIPYPTALDYAINEDGITFYNGSDNYTLFVERADEEKGFITLSSFKRVALINPRQKFLDDDVVSGRVYKYRFRHYYGKLKTYSPALVKTLKYYKPIKLENVKVTTSGSKVCIDTKLSDTVLYADIMVNSQKQDSITTGIKKCFPMPDTSLISVMAVPYDNEKNPGQAYSTTIKNKVNKNLPPQNIIVRRSENDIVITWDEEKNITQYNIYLLTNGRSRRIATPDVPLFRYKAKTSDCVDFNISTVRNGRESKKIKVSACL